MPEIGIRELCFIMEISFLIRFLEWFLCENVDFKGLFCVVLPKIFLAKILRMVKIYDCMLYK